MKRSIIKIILIALALIGMALAARAENWAERKTPFYSASHITSSATTTVTSTTSYISSIVVTVTNAGTTWTLQIKNKESTAKILYTNSGTGVTVGTFTVGFDVPVLSTSGIDITTSGTAGVMDVFLTYWQQ